MRAIPPNERPATEQTNYAWWTDAKPAECMLRTARRIASRQAFVREQNLWHARLHGGVEIAGLTPSGYARPTVQVQVGETIGLNVIENMCSAAQAEICQNKPKATFTTDGADWDKRQRAEKLDKFCEGQFYKTDLYGLAPRVLLDACIFGTGILKIYEWDDDVKIERVFPWELLIDQADGLYGDPQCFYQVKYVDRSVLIAAYPDFADKLRDPGLGSGSLFMGKDPFMSDTTADLLMVVEGWRLPTTSDADDGMHIIAVGDDIELLNEPCESHPFVFLRWLTRPFGFWGKGLTEQLAGIQKEINRLLLKIQRAFARLGITRVFLERGSKVNPAHLRAQDGDIVEYTGTPPQTVPSATVSPEIFQHLWQLETKAYEITGISQLSAQGQTVAGDVSGKALRTILQNHSKRMIIAANGYEEFFVQAAEKMIAVARGLGKKYVVRFNTDGGFEEIRFADIKLNEDEYDIRAFPTSALPSNPAEKMATVQDWTNAGWIQPDDAMQLLDFPDTKQFIESNPAVASKRSISRKLNAIVKEGKPWIPDSFVDLKVAKAMAVSLLLNAEEQHCPVDRLDMLRDTIEILVAKDTPPPPPPVVQTPAQTAQPAQPAQQAQPAAPAQVPVAQS